MDVRTRSSHIEYTVRLRSPSFLFWFTCHHIPYLMPTRRHLILEVQKCAVISPNAAIVYNLTKMFREQIRLHKKSEASNLFENNSLTLFFTWPRIHHH